jgi:hypothetical protein
MRLAIKIIVGTAIIAASVAAATLSASAPAAASESSSVLTFSDYSARKKHHTTTPNGTTLRVTRLSRRAADPPNPNRPYYRPVPHFYPFGQDRGFF